MEINEHQVAAAWRKAMGYSQKGLDEALGVSRAAAQIMEKRF